MHAKSIGCLSTLIGLVAATVATTSAPAADEKAAVEKVIPFVEVKFTEPVVFDKHVFPILAEKCMTCHDAAGGLAESGLDLTTVAALQKGGKKGSALVSGKGADSLIIKFASRAAKPYMPPKGETPLSSQELSTIKLWIDQGAKPGTNLNPAEAQRKEIVLGDLPPGVHPVYGLDLDKTGSLLAAGRANQVFVYDAASGGLRTQLSGHKDIVQSVRISPDGKLIAAGGYKVVKLWQVPQDVQKSTAPGHQAIAYRFAVSPDGKLAVSVSDDKTARLWDIATGKELRQFAGHPAQVFAAAFNPNGQQVATGCADNKIRIFNVADGKLLHTIEGQGGAALALTYRADGKWLVVGANDNVVRALDLAAATAPPAKPNPAAKAAAKDAKPMSPHKEFKGHGRAIRQLAIAGTTIVSASEEGVVKFWNLADGKEIKTVNPVTQPTAMALSADGKLLALAGGDRIVRLVNLPEGTAQAHAYTTGVEQATAMAFSKTGGELAIVSGSQPMGPQQPYIRSWDLKTGALLGSFVGHTQPVTSVAFAGDAATLLSAGNDKTVRVWQAGGAWGKSVDLEGFADRVVALAFSPDGKLLATGGGPPSAGGELTIWDVAAKQKVRVFKDAHSDTVFGVAFSPDGKLLASCAADKFLKVHEVATGKFVKSFEGHTHHVLGVDWKGDGKELATSSADNSIKIWDFAQGEQLRTVGGHNNHVTGLRYIGATDRLVSSCADKQVRRVVASNGGVERGYAGPTDFLFCVSTSFDGKRVAAGGQDGKVFLWDGDNGQLLFTFDVPQKPTGQAAK